jgi:hypothetical protein
VRLDRLAVLVLQHVGAVPCSTPTAPPVMLAACRPVVDAVAAGLEAVQRDAGVGDEGVEDADRVGPAADAGAHRVRQPPGQVQALLAGLDADAAGEVAHHGRERMRPGDRADEVVRAVHIGHPVAQRLVDGVLEGARAGRTGITVAPSIRIRQR